MGRRKLLKSDERRAVFGVPTSDDGLIRHYTLSLSDRLEIQTPAAGRPTNSASPSNSVSCAIPGEH